MKAQRIKEIGKEKRFAACQKWKLEMEAGAIDAEKTFFADEKLFRLGVPAGGSQNRVIWIPMATKKSDLPADLVTRGEGAWQGGASVMVCLGMSGKGAGALRFVPEGGRLNGEKCAEISENAYLVDCRAIFGVGGGSFIFQQDGASCHTSNLAQEFCANNFPRFWDKKDWPPNSPDLNLLDYFAWGYLQQQVGGKKPVCLNTLKVAIREAVRDIPLEMVKRAARNFRKRVNWRIEAGGGHFKHKMTKSAENQTEFDTSPDFVEGQGTEEIREELDEAGGSTGQ